MPTEGVAISLEGVRKRFGDIEAVREVTAEIPEGELRSASLSDANRT